MANSRADEPNGQRKEAAETLTDHDESGGKDKADHATPTTRGAVFEGRWYYYHVSTP